MLVWLHVEHLQHLIPVVVDHLDGELACYRVVEQAAGFAEETAPGGFVDVGPPGAF